LALQPGAVTLLKSGTCGARCTQTPATAFGGESLACHTACGFSSLETTACNRCLCGLLPKVVGVKLSGLVEEGHRFGELGVVDILVLYPRFLKLCLLDTSQRISDTAGSSESPDQFGSDTLKYWVGREPANSGTKAA
jgi:hypothetical protein